MLRPLAHQGAPNKLGVNRWTAHAVSQTFINTAIGAEFLDMEKHIIWHWGIQFDQLVAKAIDDGWLFMIKGVRHGKRVIAFVGCDSYATTLELTGSLAAQGALTWQEDRFPPKRAEKHEPGV